MRFNRRKHSNEALIALYEALLRPRMIEEKMLILLRQGKISKWFSGIGQEAISVGATLALKKTDYILPMHRNLGVFTSRGLPYARLFSQFQGKMSGYTKGRDRSFHFGSISDRIIGMISHLGPQLTIANGIALGNILKGEDGVTMVFSGDGGTSQGDFHEALNVASVWQLPVIFIIENNGYGLSTPNTEQFHCQNIVDKAIGYGMEGIKVDGNNILSVYDSMSKVVASIRKKPRPVLVEMMTFRMRGHEEASGTKYVPEDLLKNWGKKDPIENFSAYLKDEKIISDKDDIKLRAGISKEIEAGVNQAFAEPALHADTSIEIEDVYSPYHQIEIKPDKRGNKRDKRFVDAISDGLRQSFTKFDQLVLMGQDVAEYGGVFKVSEGFVEQFGKQRIRNTPLCESAIIGAGLGLSIQRFKSVIEMQFADFVTCGFNQIVNNLAKIHYRWAQNADVVIRMPTGGGVGAGPFHSQSTEAWFTHIPGLKVVYPSNPYDAKGLLTAAIEDPNPVLYFEHKKLYRSISEEIPDQYYTVKIGKARTIRLGSELTIITYGIGVHWAIEAIQENAQIDAEIIDLCTLLPWDKEAVKESVKKTGKVIVLHEDCLSGGIGGEIASWIAENCFTSLDAPIMRVGSLDTPVPFSNGLEQNFLPIQRFKDKLLSLYEY